MLALSRSPERNLSLQPYKVPDAPISREPTPQLESATITVRKAPAIIDPENAKLEAECSRIGFIAAPGTSDPALLTAYLQTLLSRRPKTEVEELKETFRRLFGTEYPSLEQLVKATLVGKDADLIGEYLEGFDPSVGADSLLRAFTARDPEGDPTVLDPDVARIEQTLLGPDGNERSPREVSALVLAFEFPHQQSLAGLVDRMIPDFAERHPRTAKMLSACTTPRFISPPDLRSKIRESVRPRVAHLMPEALQGKLYIVGCLPADAEIRRSTEIVIRLPAFCESDVLTQQMILQILFAIKSKRALRRFVVLLGEAPVRLLGCDARTRTRPIDEIFSCLTSTMEAETHRYRSDIVQFLLQAIRGPFDVAVEAPLRWLLDSSVAAPLKDRRFADYCRIVRELASPEKTSWYRQQPNGPVLWIDRGVSHLALRREMKSRERTAAAVPF